MAWVHIDANTDVQADALVRIEFREDGTPFGERANLIVMAGPQLVSLGEPVTTIAGLQKLRELVLGGSGSTAWLLARTPGTVGDAENSFVNLDLTARVQFGVASDGPVARVTAMNGSDAGEVHQPAALQKLRDVVKE